jgi:YegS/Rv2252/BmrU family lipid kinase
MTERTAVVIYNPRSGAHRKRDRSAAVADYITRLAKRGIRAEPAPTTAPGAATELARQAVASGVGLVIGNGGDGTLNEILQGMVGSSVPLAILPGGTANVLAHDLKIPTDLAANADMVANGIERRITVGRVAYGAEQIRHFFLMAGIGLDATMVRNVRSNLKKKIGEGAYLVAGIEQLIAHTTPFTVEANGQTYESCFAVIGNSHGYGGGFSLTPKADITSPTFEVSIFPKNRFGIEYAPHALAALLGKPNLLGDVVTIQAVTVTVTPATNEEVWAQVDGELLDKLPMTFEALPNALTVIVTA